MRSLLTFIVVMTVGALIALLTGLAFPSFAAGVAYMLAAALLVNSLATRS